MTNSIIVRWPSVLLATIALGGAACEADEQQATGKNASECDTCTADLQTCTTDEEACVTSRDACTTARNACTADLQTCTANEEACVTSREACEETRDAFQDNRYRQTGAVSNLDLFSPMCSATNTDRILPDGNLGVFQDSKFGGQSQVWWRVNRSCAVGATEQGCCFELHYRFIARRTTTYTPYAGILAHFTYLPYGPIDVSGYAGLGMLARAEPTAGSPPRVVLQLADIGPNTSSENWVPGCRDGFFETPVFEFNAAPTAFTEVNKNFTDFTRPFWYNCSRTTPLQTNRIYKVAIILLNMSTTETNLEGRVAFSNLHFR